MFPPLVIFEDHPAATVPTVRLQSLPILVPDFRKNRCVADNCLKAYGLYHATIDYMPQRCRVKLRPNRSERKVLAIVAIGLEPAGQAKESVVNDD